MMDNTNLPHQEDEIRPEGVVDHEQEPPEVPVTPADYAHIPKDKRALSTTLQNDDKELQKFLEEHKPMKIAPPPPAKLGETHLMKIPEKAKTKKPGKLASLVKKLFSK